MNKILIATGNAHKVGEIQAVLKDLNIELLSLKDLDPEPNEALETGTTFYDNALIKARHYAWNFDGPVLADDSGLTLPGLDGEPGIYSSRYAGSDATDASNRAHLLKRISEKGLRNPEAYFSCVLCLYRASMEPRFFEGRWQGRIINAERGDQGFGYDPLFVPEGEERTAAELPPKEKNSNSHRGKALAEFQKFLKEEIEE